MLLVSGLDVILALILLFLFTIGFVYGFIHAIGTLLGIIIGVWAANQYYLAITYWLVVLLPSLEKFVFNEAGYNWPSIIIFILVAVVIQKLIGLLFLGIDKLMRLLYIIPFFKTVNRLMGALVGLLEGALIIGLIVHFLIQFELVKPYVENYIASSKLAIFLSNIGQFLAPLLPILLHKLTSIF